MLKQAQLKSKGSLEARINGTAQSALIRELLTNSGHFWLLKSLADIILTGWSNFFSEPTEYLLLAAMLVQAWYLSRPNTHRFWGNLIGVTIYTLIDLPTDRWEFFQNPIHIIFWAFSLVIAILQGLQYHGSFCARSWMILLESMARTFMVVALYVTIGIKPAPQTTYVQQILNFTQTKNHKFLLASMILMGLHLGLQTLQINGQQQQLRKTAQELRNLAEWGLGSYAVATAVTNPEALALHRCDRTILFIDIRGFTSWCEQTTAEEVVVTLNRYYCEVESAAAFYQPLRLSFTGDEVMAIFATPQQGIVAAQSMLAAAQRAVACCGVGAGCGVHCGSLIEGLFGGKDVRTYTVIGDVVNTAKRLESATPAGRITLSDAVYQATNQQLKVEPCKPIIAKGKTEPIIAWRLIAVL